MSSPDPHLREFFARLERAAHDERAAPDLWQRISAARDLQQRRRRRLRLVAIASASALAAVAFAVLLRLPAMPGAAVIDWQARAQALELQWDAVPLPARFDAHADSTRDAIVQLDRTLQAAYDRGAAAREVSRLWQRRSELLQQLIASRDPVPTQI